MTLLNKALLPTGLLLLVTVMLNHDQSLELVDTHTKCPMRFNAANNMADEGAHSSYWVRPDASSPFWQ